MKIMLLILAFFAIIFAQDDGVFIPDGMYDAAETDTLFSVEFLNETDTAIEPTHGDIEIYPEILLSVDSKMQTIVCEFLENSDGKIIEILTLSGYSVFEISVDSDKNSISFPIKKFEKGIYIVRILSPETRRSVFSKAIVIG